MFYKIGNPPLDDLDRSAAFVDGKRVRRPSLVLVSKLVQADDWLSERVN